MLDSFDLRKVEQAEKCVLVKDLSVRCKSGAEFESEHVRVSAADLFVDAGLFGGRRPVETSRLENYRCSASLDDRIHLSPIKSNHVARLMLDEGTGNERNTVNERLARPAQHIVLLSYGKQVDVASVHIDSIRQPGMMCREKMPLERIDRDPLVVLIGQERSGNARDLPAKLSLAGDCFDRHNSDLKRSCCKTLK